MKGQITIVNLLGVVVSLILYLAMLPAIQSIIDSTITTLELTPNDFTPMLKIIIYITPAFVLLAIVLTAINYAIPQREPRGRLK